MRPALRLIPERRDPIVLPTGEAVDKLVAACPTPLNTLVRFLEWTGMRLEEAVVEAGIERFRPMLITAAAVVAGSFVMLFDPIFQGLAISLMTGEVAATLLSRLAVPVVYYLLARRRGTNAARERALEPQDIETLAGSAA